VVTVYVHIVGTTPLLHRRFDDFFPSNWIIGAIREAASNHKLRGSRKLAKLLVPVAVHVPTENIQLLTGDGKSHIKDCNVEVLIAYRQGRRIVFWSGVLRGGPAWSGWVG